MCVQMCVCKCACIDVHMCVKRSTVGVLLQELSALIFETGSVVGIWGFLIRLNRLASESNDPPVSASPVAGPVGTLPVAPRSEWKTHPFLLHGFLFR